MNENSGSGSDLWRAVAKLWYVVLACVLAAVAVGAWYASRPQEWTSEATLLLRPSPGNALSAETMTSSQQSVIALNTEAALVTSPAVVQLANDQSAKDDSSVRFKAGDPRVDASVADNTQIMTIRFRGESSAEATDGARALAKAFLDFRLNQSTQVRQRRLDALKDQLDDAQDRLTRWLSASTPEDKAVAATQVQLWSSRVAAVQESIGTAESEDTNPGRVVAPPSTPERTGLAPTTLLLAAGLLGLIVGAALALLLAAFRRRRV